MNNRRTKAIIKILASQLAVVLFVTALALFILFYAEGYRFNYKNLKISKTGVVSITSYPKDVIVIINGKIKDKKTPYSINLLPSRCDIKLTKDGYSVWEQSVLVQSGYVNSFKNIVLFKETPEIRTLTDQKTINQLNSPIDALAIKNDNGLYYSDYEIWVNGNLVTRFSEPISSAIWYPDKQHVIYLQKNQIRIIEITGKNDTLLINKVEPGSFPTKYILNDKGDQLYYRDNGEYKTAIIR